MSQNNILIVFIVLMLHSDFLFARKKPIVETTLGFIKGEFKVSYNGRTFSSFEGIPYAKPPIGHRRFEPPEPIEPWNHIWNANFTRICPQKFKTSLVLGDEDCLYLNIYVPFGKSTPNNKLDVLVYIHGGGYAIGSSSNVKPFVIMDRDVILVTFDFRLGVLGFLTTEDLIVPGNMGLKDQVLALQWIQDHIESFGGNPKSVTIMGDSTGAGSVHLHYFSKKSKDLFQRGFSLSGTALNFWNVQKNGLGKVRMLGKALLCDSDEPDRIIECLKEKSVLELFTKIDIFKDGQFPMVPFGPTVEQNHEGAFLSQNVMQILTENQIHDYPWMSSMVTHDGFMVVKHLDDLSQLDNNWNTLAPLILDYNYTLVPALWNYTSEKIKNHYLGTKKFIDDVQALTAIFDDRYFLVDAETAMRLQAKMNKAPVFHFMFEYSIVSHSDDLKYYFGMNDYYFHEYHLVPLNDNELKMQNIMLNMLVTYMKTGVPKIEGVNWLPVKCDQLNYLQIDGFELKYIRMTSSKEDLTPRSFWKSLRIDKEFVDSTKTQLLRYC